MYISSTSSCGIFGTYSIILAPSSLLFVVEYLYVSRFLLRPCPCPCWCPVGKGIRTMSLSLRRGLGVEDSARAYSLRPLVLVLSGCA